MHLNQRRVISQPMNEVTKILQTAASGDTGENVTAKLLPLVYDELRRLAAHQMAGQRSGQTLQATALVHEAYLRLVGRDEPNYQHWDGRGHFFAAAAEAMRRILIDRARQKQCLKRGGDQARATWDESKVGGAAAPEEILAVDEALTKLSQEDPDLARIVKLRYFAGMTVSETAAAIGVSPSTVDRQWACARAWLYREITEGT
ncbi:MAG: sigma-70 family RNA polymerase sigma factor [Verrucomicrobiales bacterium]|nr:sigma-70 family RNA polymerase sigma factor [Verrucomicrobiales bacterium]